MKNYLLLLSTVFSITLISCNNNNQSAFTGEVKKTVAPVGTIPEESIFNLTDTFTTQENKQIHLKDLSGKPTVLAMIFTHCDYACPRLTADIQGIESRLGADAAKVNFVLASFDSERDFPAQLEKFKKEMKLDNNFTLLHGNEDAVRSLSVLLNVQFQKNQDGNFSHSNLISVLDPSGNLTFQQEGIQANHDETIQKIQAMLKH